VRGRARATWAAGDWDTCARLIAPVGQLVIERAGIEPGVELVDVGTGSGGNIAGGRVLMTTWADSGFIGEMFKLTGAFMPPPPPGVQPPPLWGVEAHVRKMFGAAGAVPEIARERVVAEFASVEDVVQEYTVHFGPFVTARGVLGPHGRWDEFVAAFGDLVRRFDAGDGDRARMESEYFLITVER
jgi:hypothetical protein